MKETELKILIYGNKELRKKALPVKVVGDEERRMLEEMAKIMYASKGIGIAATQLGIAKQLIVIDIGEGLCKFINPKIKDKQGLCMMQEGCLSVPDVVVDVKRAKKIFVQAKDEFNKDISFWAENLFARAMQHEIDHLQGKLIIDYLGLLKKIDIRKKIKRKHNLGEHSETKLSG